MRIRVAPDVIGTLNYDPANGHLTLETERELQESDRESVRWAREEARRQYEATGVDLIPFVRTKDGYLIIDTQDACDWFGYGRGVAFND